MRQKCPPPYLAYSTQINHLTPSFQRELPMFPMSWGYKNWLLTHRKPLLSLEPARHPSSILRALSGCQVSPPHLQHLHYLCSLLSINSRPSEMLCLEILFQLALELPGQKCVLYRLGFSPQVWDTAAANICYKPKPHTGSTKKDHKHHDTCSCTAPSPPPRPLRWTERHVPRVPEQTWTCVISLNPHSNPRSRLLLSLVYRWGNS